MPESVAALRARVHGLTASRWNEALHPRGRDGKFIHKGGFVSGLFRWFDRLSDGGSAVPERAHRAKVTNFMERPGGGVSVLVEDPARPGKIGIADAASIVEVAPPRAVLDTGLTGRDGQPIAVGQKIELNDMPGFRHGQRGKYEVEGEVIEIIEGESPIVRVQMTDTRWDPGQFGATYDARPDQVAAVGFKGKPKTKKPSSPKHHAAVPDTGEIPPRSELTGYSPSPDGPGFLPLEPHADWFDMEAAARLAWLKEVMEADFTAWRGDPVVIDFTGYNSGIAFNLANTYRELANWDPDTARRIDKLIPGDMDTDGGLGFSAIAVAHPGTAHVGGIGPKIKDSAIVLKESYFASMSKWQKHHGSGMPWSMSEFGGDPTLTLVHEFAHQRQFRFLHLSMSEVGKAWSPVVTSDGFGMIPDSSNWPITQQLRYTIPKLSPTKYGQSKSSEGFAEAWAARAVGKASPELVAVLDEWDAYMGLTLHLPQDRYDTTKSYDSLTPDEQGVFWEQAGAAFSLPGMREHYPESAAAYDEWVVTTQEAVAV